MPDPTSAAVTLGIDADTLGRYDVPGPRYTSYPPATAFASDVDAGVAMSHLRALAAADGPLALYVHLPFCEQRCAFCACNVTVARDRNLATRYVDRVVREVDMVADVVGGRSGGADVVGGRSEGADVAALHLGGGTPTYCSLGDLDRLITTLRRRFRFRPDAELAIECDPRVTTDAQLKALARWGFRRISVGIQDLDADVQRAIGRNQCADDVRRLFVRARRCGFTSLNADLVFGLPHQSAESWTRTLESVIALEPERLAVYGFAFVPWVHRNQRRLDMTRLPGRDERLELALRAADMLQAAGYVRIGMDHFARPDDELVRARRDGRLRRTFMGYTVAHADNTLAFGASAIGDVAGAYLQNHKRLASYYAAVDAGRLPVERGYVRNADDELRRYVIGELMCNAHVRFADVRARFGVEPAEVFAEELARLHGADRADGNVAGAELAALVAVDTDGIELTELGTWFSRNVAMVFDAISRPRSDAEPRFSRTV